MGRGLWWLHVRRCPRPALYVLRAAPTDWATVPRSIADDVAARRMPVVVGLGALVSTIQGSLHFLGGRIDSFKKEEDEFERKEKLRRTTRVPIEQTVAEIGEGRGEPIPSRTGGIRDVLTLDQASVPTATRSGGESGSRRRTGSRSTPSARLSRAANKATGDQPIHTSRTCTYLFWGGGRAATTRELEFLCLTHTPCSRRFAGLTSGC